MDRGELGESKPLMAATEKPKRKRRKITKSCAFCRKRKLRCDQQRPLCSTCSARKFTQCVYVNEVGNAGNGRRGGSPATLEDDLDELEVGADDIVGANTSYVTFAHSKSDDSVQLRRSVYQVATKGLTVSSSENPLTNFFTLQCKESGRRIFYGATSFRTFMAKYNWELMQRFIQAWSKLKKIRRQMKKKSGFSMLKELTVVEEPVSGKPSSIIAEITELLPSSETIVSSINHFFDDDQLFIINGTLDRSKVLRDFEQGFQRGELQSKNGETPIVALVPSSKKNYYKIGVIVMILAMTHYRDQIPLAIERFLIYLTGTSTGKSMYVERAQLLLLRCHYRTVYAHTGGDNSHLMLLVDNMISTAIYLGLNKDIPSLYDGQEGVVGNVGSLQRLWYWIVFADLDVAINLGRSLKISPYDYDDDEMLGDHSKTYYGVMKRFLKVARPVLLDVHNKKAAPNLRQHCKTLIDFIEQEFPPVGIYSTSDGGFGKGFLESRILCQALSLLIAFYGLRFFALKELSPAVKNGAIKAILISCSLCVKLTLFCSELDRSRFPELMKPKCKGTSPYMCVCLSQISSVFIRSIGMFYAFAYCEMTFFENGLILVQGYDETTDCDLSTLRSEGGQTITFKTYFKLACERLDLLTDASDPILRRLLRRSQGYVIHLGLVTVMRTVIQTALHSRTHAETSWLSSSQQLQKLNAEDKVPATMETESSGQLSTAVTKPDRDSSEPDQCTKSHINMSNSPRAIPENDTTLTISKGFNVDEVGIRTDADFGPEGFPSRQPIVKLSDQMESEMTQLIEQEFWGNYNLGWQELLESTDLESLFPDFVL